VFLPNQHFLDIYPKNPSQEPIFPARLANLIIQSNRVLSFLPDGKSQCD
jgi:hypothetical protein